MSEPQITIITPTIGNPSLSRLCDSIEAQKIPVVHLLLWDSKMSDDPKANCPLVMKEYKDCGYHYNLVQIELPYRMIQGQACGSALRAVGMMAANTEFVTFADDDVWHEENHLQSLLDAIKDKNWAYSKRKIWKSDTECIGIDNFESIGDKSDLPYSLVDNNTLMFRRKFGVSASPLYRNTEDYNDDRLMYGFLKKYAGDEAITDLATVNQICPQRLINFFDCNCEKEEPNE